jgi:crossover junction endodeoxyribonuclease RuvC
MRLIGLDPGLRRTGWGVIEAAAGRLSHVANGTVVSDGDAPLSERLLQIHSGLMEVIERWRPAVAAVEETFVNKNPVSTLKLGQVRGVVLLAPALSGVPVAEYSPNKIKQSVVGGGHAAKDQIHAMVRILLPGVLVNGADAADALAVAICHAHHAQSLSRWASNAGAWPNHRA